MPSAAYAQSSLDTSFFRGLRWRNVAPSQGGRATTGVGVPADPQTYYMGATGGGVWKTENGGRSWRNISDGFFNTGSIGDIAVYKGDPSTVYVGTGEAPARGEMSTYGDGMYKSTDAGRTWAHIGLASSKQISRVLIHPANANIVYVAGQGDQWGPTDERGIYLTTDGGATWKRVLFVNATTGASDLQMDPNDPRVLYAAMWDHDRGIGPDEFRTIGPGSGIWKSTDGGDTWTQLKTGLPSLTGKIRLGLAPSMPNRIYANVEADDGGLFRSDDAGATWRRVNDSRGVRTRAWYYLGTTVDPRNADLVYVTGVALLKSTDGGTTFNSVSNGHSDTHSLWINPSNSQNMILTDDGGAEITFDGATTWSSLGNQPTAQFYSVSVDDLFPYNLYSGQQDNSSVKIASQTFGANAGGGAFGPEARNFTPVGGGETARMAFDPKNPRVVFVTNYWGIIEAFDTQTGLSRMISQWPQEPIGTAPHRYNFNWSAALSHSLTNRGVIYHAGTVVFRTRDAGYHWDKISPVLTRVPGRGSEQSTIYDVVESPLEPQTIWAGTDEGLVHVTRDDGKTWRNVTPVEMPEGSVTAIEVSPHDKGTAYFALSRLRWQDYTPYIYKTTDYGQTWRIISGNLPRGFPARVVREDPKRRNLLYAGTENGVLVSFDAGERWHSLQSNLPRVPISNLRVHQGDLVASTEGRAFWILDDISALSQLTDAATTARLTLLAPRPSYRLVAGSERSAGGGGSPPAGANIFYVLDRAAVASPDSLVLEIVDAKSAIVRRVVAAPGAPRTEPEPTTGRGGGRGGRGSVGQPAILVRSAGLNRFLWNFRTAPQEGGVGPGGAPVGTPGPVGYALPSGHYTVRMRLGATTVSQPLDVLMDPRVSTSIAWETEHTEMARAITARAVEINAALREVRDLKTQARAIAERAKANPNASRDAVLREYVALADSVDEKLLQNRYATGPGTQDFLNYPPGLLSEYSYLIGLIDGSAGPLTQAERERFADLDVQWKTLRARLDALLTTGMQRLNTALSSSGITPGLSRPKS